MDETIPAPLGLVRDFVNTHDVYRGDDDLRSAAEVAAWFSAHDLAPAGSPLDERDVAAAHELREALRRVLLANTDKRPEPDALATLDRIASRARLQLRFSPKGTDLQPDAAPGDAALSRILTGVHRAMIDGSWQRLKACRSEDCEWIFYDRSRNKSARWCTMKVCGNRNKARRFRAKQGSEHNH